MPIEEVRSRSSLSELQLFALRPYGLMFTYLSFFLVSPPFLLVKIKASPVNSPQFVYLLVAIKNGGGGKGGVSGHVTVDGALFWS